MSRIKEIRKRLSVTQTDLAQALECTQGNIGHYERGQPMPVKKGELLIAFAQKKGLRLTLDQIYGRTALPPDRRTKVVNRPSVHP